MNGSLEEIVVQASLTCSHFYLPMLLMLCVGGALEKRYYRRMKEEVRESSTFAPRVERVWLRK